MPRVRATQFTVPADATFGSVEAALGWASHPGDTRAPTDLRIWSWAPGGSSLNPVLRMIADGNGRLRSEIAGWWFEPSDAVGLTRPDHRRCVDVPGLRRICVAGPVPVEDGRSRALLSQLAAAATCGRADADAVAVVTDSEDLVVDVRASQTVKGFRCNAPDARRDAGSREALAILAAIRALATQGLK